MVVPNDDQTDEVEILFKFKAIVVLTFIAIAAVGFFLSVTKAVREHL